MANNLFPFVIVNLRTYKGKGYEVIIHRLPASAPSPPKKIILAKNFHVTRLSYILCAIFEYIVMSVDSSGKQFVSMAVIFYLRSELPKLLVFCCRYQQITYILRKIIVFCTMKMLPSSVASLMIWKLGYLVVWISGGPRENIKGGMSLRDYRFKIKANWQGI